jgi:hypothetical protein
MVGLKVYPVCDHVRSDPGFRALSERMELSTWAPGAPVLREPSSAASSVLPSWPPTFLYTYPDI